MKKLKFAARLLHAFIIFLIFSYVQVVSPIEFKMYMKNYEIVEYEDVEVYVRKDIFLVEGMKGVKSFYDKDLYDYLEEIQDSKADYHTFEAGGKYYTPHYVYFSYDVLVDDKGVIQTKIIDSKIK